MENGWTVGKMVLLHYWKNWCDSGEKLGCI